MDRRPPVEDAPIQPVRGALRHASGRCARARCGAFSLLEILLALAIFSITLLGLIEGIAMQIRAEALAEDTTRATMLAQNIVEEIRLNQEFEVQEETGEFENEGKGFSWKYQLEETGIKNLYLVRATVSWSDGATERDVTLETYMSERSKITGMVLGFDEEETDAPGGGAARTRR